MSGDASNPYTVRVVGGTAGWEVHIMAEDGEVQTVRHCVDEAEARTFASTVNQHIYWLSAEKFREYYRLDRPA